MEQSVTVIAVEGEQAIVSGRRASACGDCAGKASCSTMGSWVDRSIELRVKNGLHAKVGDQVVLEVPDHALLRTAFRLYALPMLAFIAVGLAVRWLAIANSWPAADALAALTGFTAVLGCYSGFRFFPSGSHSLDVHMKRVIAQSCDYVPIRLHPSSE